MSAELAVVLPSPVDILDKIIDGLRDKSLDLDRANMLLSIQERIQDNLDKQRDRQRKAEFDEAASRARAKMPAIIKATLNPNTKSYYAKLDHLTPIICPIYEAEQLQVDWIPNREAFTRGRVGLEMAVRYTPNAWVEKIYLEADPDSKGPKGGDQKTEVQGMISSVSYIKRNLHILFWDLHFLDKSDNDGNTRGPYTDAPPSGKFEVITTEQALDLVDLAKATGASETKICEFAKVNRFEELPVNLYERVKNILKARPRKYG